MDKKKKLKELMLEIEDAEDQVRYGEYMIEEGKDELVELKKELKKFFAGR
tara:strand:- start:1356 stop:1505 length:150 start_codon:yes stop_codon:yes gene_type:complete